MDNETNVNADTTNSEQAVEQVETVSLTKSEYEKLNQTLGSLKRELKDLKKPKEETVKETSTQSDNNPLLERIEKMAIRQAGITEQEDIDLARNTAKKWGVDIDEVLTDPDFQAKLQRQQDARANSIATSNIKGGAGTSQAKNTPEYWIAKGIPPTPSDVPDRKTRVKIARAFMDSSKNSKKFYSD